MRPPTPGGGGTRPPYDGSGRAPWDDALRPPTPGGGGSRPLYNGTGRVPWDGQGRPPYASGGFNVAPAVPGGLVESQDSSQMSAIANEEQIIELKN